MVYDRRAQCYILDTFSRKAKSPNAVKEEEEGGGWKSANENENPHTEVVGKNGPLHKSELRTQTQAPRKPETTK